VQGLLADEGLFTARSWRSSSMPTWCLERWHPAASARPSWNFTASDIRRWRAPRFCPKSQESCGCRRPPPW